VYSEEVKKYFHSKNVISLYFLLLTHVLIELVDKKLQNKEVQAKNTLKSFHTYIQVVSMVITMNSWIE